MPEHTTRTPQERARIADELENIWRNLDEPIERRRKARTAWDALTAAPLRSYGNPATFVGDNAVKRPTARLHSRQR